MKVRAVAIITEVSMQKNHHGLLDLVKNLEIEDKDLIIFVNKRWSSYKAIVGPVLAYYRSPGDKLTVNDFKRLPLFFGGQRLVLSREVEKALNQWANGALKEVGT